MTTPSESTSAASQHRWRHYFVAFAILTATSAASAAVSHPLPGESITKHFRNMLKSFRGGGGRGLLTLQKVCFDFFRVSGALASLFGFFAPGKPKNICLGKILSMLLKCLLLNYLRSKVK